MSQHFLRQSPKIYTRRLTCLVKSRSYSSKSSSWFTRFLSPSEEKKLYLGITSAFREKLVEQSNKSAQTYSHIIEHAILSAKPVPSKTSNTGMLSIARIEQLKIDLDAAGKAKDMDKLRQLEAEMDNAHLQTVTIYNRLIRAYLWNHDIDAAENVLNKLGERGLVPTTRSFIYLIQAHLKKGQLKEAKELVSRMQHLSLLRLRNSFDCSIMFKYYEACGETHAIEFLWRDISLHMDTIKPGTGLFTQYMEYLLPSIDTETARQVTKDFLSRHLDQVFTLHQYVVWNKAIMALAQKDTIQTAEQLLYYVIKNAPPKMSWDKTKHAIQQIVSTYLSQDQELRAIALYYKLRKMGVPDQAFDTQMTQSIDRAVKDMEDNTQTKATMTELEGLIIAKA